MERTDHIGRPVFATNTSGVKVWEASYGPFGEVVASTGPAIGLRFPGQWYQAETGLHQNWMRDYDPTTGRYLQADPLGLIDGASVYGYVRQNPGRYVDPRGEFGAVGALLGAGSNLALQVGVSILRGQDISTAFKCVNWSTVVASAAFGAVGASPLAVYKMGGAKRALGAAIVTTYTKKIKLPPMVFGDSCECEAGDFSDGAIGTILDFFTSFQL